MTEQEGPPKMVIYLPALNEAGSIARVITGLPRQLPGVGSILCLVVDDGSVDATASLARAAGAQVISHRRNRGVGAAFQSAVQYALEEGAAILLGMDADGQFDAAEIPSLIEPILAGEADMVLGNRFVSGRPNHMSAVKYWGNQQMARLISSAIGQEFRDVSCGFRAYAREALMRMNVFAEFTYTHEAILSVAYQGLRIRECPITVQYYPDRKSRVAGSIPRYALQTSKIILRVMLDYRPIRVFGAFGATSVLLGLGCETFLFTHYLLTHSFSPYKAVGFIGLGFLVFGMLVLLVALIADMLNRLRINQDRILYGLKKILYAR